MSCALQIDCAITQLLELVECLVFSDGTSKTQINKVVCHPTLPIVVSAHEDKYIRFYDANTGKDSRVAVCIVINLYILYHMNVCICVLAVCRKTDSLHDGPHGFCVGTGY